MLILNILLQYLKGLFTLTFSLPSYFVKIWNLNKDNFEVNIKCVHNHQRCVQCTHTLLGVRSRVSRKFWSLIRARQNPHNHHQTSRGFNMKHWHLGSSAWAICQKYCQQTKSGSRFLFATQMSIWTFLAFAPSCPGARVSTAGCKFTCPSNHHHHNPHVYSYLS